MPVGLIDRDQEHYLDHIAPLCALLDIPLILTNKDLASLAQTYYPDLKTFEINPISLPSYLLTNHSTVISCLPRPLLDEVFFFESRFFNKQLTSIWLPHGNSDKGLNGLSQEQGLFFYGEKMEAVFRKKNLLSLQCIGNYRSLYFNLHKQFYQNRIHLPPNNRTILYAPTWEDRETSSSFQQSIPYLIENLPRDYNLIFKPHPNLFIQYPQLLKELKEKTQNHPNILILENFPPIHPILDIADLYLGDYSSIGYDFLGQDKPLFFINPSQASLDLHRCGMQISSKIYHEIDEKYEHNLKHFRAIRKQMYLHTFDQILDWETRKKELLNFIPQVAENERV